VTEIGHNGIAADQLRSVVDRIENLEGEKKALAEDIKEVYQEAKGNGFDTKVLRSLIGLRKKSANEREEMEAMLDLYKEALGMTTG
jgi:uncharacterized protein (UPF0335 family)